MSKASAPQSPLAPNPFAEPRHSASHAWQGLITDVPVNGENLPSRVHWSLGSTLCLAFASSAVLWVVIIVGAKLLLRALA